MNEIIKRWLLDGQFRVYSVIVSTYSEKIKELKPLLFKQWLAQELGIGEEKINLGSLNSALTRKRKKEGKKASFGTPTSNPTSEPTQESNQHTGFKFSVPNADTDKKSSTREY
jgi:hypothetical protein